MSAQRKQRKAPMTQEHIFLIIMVLTFAVAAIFFIRNLAGGNHQSAFIIGACLLVFAVVVFIMRRLHARGMVQMMVLCILLVGLVLFISLNSGSYYSDDFPLFLALVALTGLYLEPACTIVQTAAIDVALVVMYLVHPEKAESLSQYIMCAFIFNIAAFINFMVIRRGRAYIHIADDRAAEAEKLLDSIKAVGEELQHSYESSTERINGMREVSARLKLSTDQLMQGSDSIDREAGEVANACAQVEDRMQATGGRVSALNQEVRKVEAALDENRAQINAMDDQIRQVETAIGETRQVFEALWKDMLNISKLTEQLGSIASNTKMLAVNASIEAARAGEHGAGFSVVANEVQTLALDSNGCSDQVTEVVDVMRRRVEASGRQLEGSAQSIQQTLSTLGELHGGFSELMAQFDSLYGNITAQTGDLQDMADIFRSLQDRVEDMGSSSGENRAAVESIVNALASHKAHTDLIIDDARSLHSLSASMLSASGD